MDNPLDPALANQNVAGIYGWGQGMYIPNNADVQANSDNLTGGYSLRSDWLNPPNSATGNPADCIPLARRLRVRAGRRDHHPLPGLLYSRILCRMTARTDTNRRYFFRRPNGGAPTGGSQTVCATFTKSCAIPK